MDTTIEQFRTRKLGEVTRYRAEPQRVARAKSFANMSKKAQHLSPFMQELVDSAVETAHEIVRNNPGYSEHESAALLISMHWSAEAACVAAEARPRRDGAPQCAPSQAQCNGAAGTATHWLVYATCHVQHEVRLTVHSSCSHDVPGTLARHGASECAA